MRGGEAVGALRLERKLTTVAWKQLRDAAPERFPSVESLALAGDRLRGIAAQYARLRAGEISRLALLHRTGLGEAQLRLGTVAKTRGDLQ